jgi:hypothetical protein
MRLKEKAGKSLKIVKDIKCSISTGMVNKFFSNF